MRRRTSSTCVPPHHLATVMLIGLSLLAYGTNVQATTQTGTTQAGTTQTGTTQTGATESGPSASPVSGLRVPQGFEIQQVAAAPLVTHPTLACLDSHGRLYVCNNAGVNMTQAELEEHLPNEIRRLEDLDGDGVYDRATVFADKMTYPMGGVFYRGSLYVASPPYIWRLTDTNDDGVADRREQLVSKFGYNGNAASIHGCFLGPDGRIYWCDGYHGHEFRDAAGRITSQREGSYLFSCRPDGSDVRIYCGGGMDNPVEIDFTDEGELLGSVNIMYTRPRIDCIVHWQYGGVYPHRERVLGEVQVTGPRLDATHLLGHVAVSGFARYRSGVMDPAWRDNYFTTFFNSGKVVRLEAVRRGASFELTQREFLYSQRPEFHPTDVLEDADGSLLVIDTGGWFYRGCPTSQFPKPDILGAIYRIRRQDRTPPDDPRGRRLDETRLSARDWVELLADSRFSVRQRAIEYCARHPEFVPQLVQGLKHPNQRVRQNVVWSLTRMIGDHPELPLVRQALRSALHDRSLEVQLATCHALAMCPDTLALTELRSLLGHRESSLRSRAAQALGRLGDPAGVPSLLAAAQSAESREEQHAIIFALLEIDDRQQTASGLHHQHGKVRAAALIALDQMRSGQLTPEIVLEALRDPDDEVREMGWLIAHRRRHDADWAKTLAAEVARPLRSGPLPLQDPVWERMLAAFVSHEQVAQAIAARWQDPDLNSAGRNMLLGVFKQAGPTTLHPSWVQPLKQELAAADPARVRLAIEVALSLRGEALRAALRDVAADPQWPMSLRVQARQAALGGRATLDEQAFAWALDALTSGTPTEVGPIAELIGQSSLTATQLRQLAEAFHNVGPVHRVHLLRPFERDSSREVAVALLEALESLPGFESLPRTLLSDIVKRYPSDVLPRANRLLLRLQQAEQRQQDVLDEIVGRLDEGDPHRGRDVFFGQRGKCSSCHRLGSEGGQIGPDLTTIGRNRSRTDLAESIVFPSATLVRDYETYVFQLLDGRVVTGLVIREDREQVVVQPATGDPLSLSLQDIEQRKPALTSMMPAGLNQELSVREIADLVAFLKQQGM